MRRMIPVLLVVGLVWLGQKLFGNAGGQEATPARIQAVQPFSAERKPLASELGRTNAGELGTMRCDGRTRCPQMTSCTEAKFFLKNCPNVEMDGDHDGQPCEDQWCN
jgi:hypothetical protein